MMCGVSAARAIASPRLASRTSPSPLASHIPAWVACSAGIGSWSHRSVLRNAERKWNAD